MTQHLMNHIPDYIDDRLKIEATISDDLQYRYYELLASNLVSSWYDPAQDRAFSAFDMNDVPEEFRDNIIQHNTGTSPQNLMCPNLRDAQVMTASSSKTISFLSSPDFDGDSFRVWWNAENDAGAVSSYPIGFDIRDFKHEYDEYGQYAIKFSTNVKNAYMYTYYDTFLRAYANDRLRNVESRCSSLQHLRNINYSRCMQSIKAYGISCIDSEWYDGYELTSIELPDLETIICPYAVNCLYNLKDFIAPKLKFINNATGMFKGNVRLEKLNFPELTCISGDYADKTTGMGYNFMTNMSLTSVYMPKLVSGMKTDFAYCINLKETDFSSLSAVEEGMFRDCLCLKTIAFPSISLIKASAFYRCQNLKTIDLSKLDEVPTLANRNAFTGLPSNYQILVKSSLLSQFKAATNWKNAAVINHIIGI